MHFIKDCLFLKTLQSIGDSAFEKCTSLTGSGDKFVENNIPYVFIPESVNTVGASAFNGCTELLKVKFAINPTGDYTSEETKNKYIKNIGINAFLGCGLTGIELPDSITLLGTKSVGYDAKYKPIDGFTIVCANVNNAAIVSYAGETFKIDKSATAIKDPTKEPKIMYGDVTGDAKVDISDLTTLSLALLGDCTLTGDKLTAADVTGDDKIDIADLAHLKQYIMKDNVKFGK